MSHAEPPNPLYSSELPDVERFFREKPTIKPLQHSSGALKSFIAQFEQTALNPEGARRLAELSQLLENEEWCVSHDAAHDAIQNALKLAAEEAHASEKSTIESLYKAQMVQPSTLKMVKNEALADVLAPLQQHLEKYPKENMRWLKCSPRILTPVESIKPVTLGEALKQLKALGDEAAIVTAEVHEAAHHVHGPHCNHGHEPIAPKSQPSPVSSGYSGGHSAHTSSSHVHGPGCGHDHVHTSSCGHDHGASSGSPQSSYGGYSGGCDHPSHHASSTEAAVAEGTWLERAEGWLKRQKPGNIVMVASITAGAVGLLYISGKAEQRRQQQKQNDHVEAEQTDHDQSRWAEKVEQKTTPSESAAAIAA